MKIWAFSINQLPRWILYMIDSYIIYMILTLTFPIFFKTYFTLSVYFLWLIFFLFSLTFIIFKENASKFFYLLLAVLTIYGVWSLNYSPISWVIILLLLVLTFKKEEEVRLINNNIFLYRIYFYLVASFLFFLFNSFNNYQIDNTWVLISYVILICLYLFGGLFIYLKDSTISLELRKSLRYIFIFVISGLAIFLLLFNFIKDSVLALFSFFKDVLYYIFILIGNFIFSFKELEFPQSEDNISEFLSKIEPTEQDVDNDLINSTYNEEMWRNIETVVIGLVIIAAVFLIYKSIKKIDFNSTNENGTINEVIQYSYEIEDKKKRKRFTSSDFHRKSYQRFLLWLKKSKQIDINNSVTSSDIRREINIKHPNVSNEINEITDIYQKIRYGNENPTISKKEYKELINSVKKIKN